LKAWRAAGDEIILFADLNENIYTGPIARQLRGDGILMQEQTLLSTGKEAPHGHYTGKIAIVGTFAMPGIKCTNSYLSPHEQEWGTTGSNFMTSMHTRSSVLTTQRLCDPLAMPYGVAWKGQ